jgi:DhnA family fructose-bisphosphate aldolase class Ia
MSYLGKAVRLGRLFQQDGRTLMITMDHAIAHGVLSGLERPADTLRRIVSASPDAVVLQKGIASNHWPHQSRGVSLVLKATSYSPYHPTVDSPTATVNEAVRLGADAISVGVILGGLYQREQTQYLAATVREAEDAGLPVGSHIYARGESIKAATVAATSDAVYCCRVGAELGADFVKTSWTGSADSFREVVSAAGTRVVLAGGTPSASGVEDLLIMTNAALAAGAAGVTYGRAIWSRPDIEAVIAALDLVVHKGLSPAEALKAARCDGAQAGL